MESVSTRLTLAALLLTLATPLFAVTYIVPSDAEMIQRSDDIVVATGVTASVERTAGGRVVTRYYLRVEEVLKGKRARGSHLVVTEAGGFLAGSRFHVVIPGTPVYEPAQRYLVFTSSNADGDPTTFGMALGQFRFEDREGRTVVTRGAIHGFNQNLESYTERDRDARGFLAYVRDLVVLRAPQASYFVDRKLPVGDFGGSFTRASYLFSENPRWPDAPNSSIFTSGSQGSLDGVPSVTNAINEWNNTDSNIAYTYAGVNNAALGGLRDGFHDGIDAVLFGDPNNEVTPPVAGIGGYWSSGGQHSVGGETGFLSIDGGVDIVIDQAVSSAACLLDVMTHEMGHTLGFRHSNLGKNDGGCGAPLDCTSDAIMNSTVFCNAGGQLKDWDRRAAATVYGAGPVEPPCNAPAINQHPASQPITSGNSATLSVGATGTAPLSYQWYQGTPTDTSTPAGTGNSISVSPTATTSYWVRVSHACSTAVADSNAAVITVNPFVCPSVSVGTPQAQQQANGTYRLSVTATSSGRPMIFEWFQGTTPGSGGTFVDLTSQIFVPPSTVETSYWVRVTNDCENSAVSGLIVVPACVLPAINTQPQDQSILSGGSATLSLTHSASSATVRWYRGAVGNTSTQIGTGNSVNTGALTSTTLFFALVSNFCGDTASRQVTVTVAGCDLAAIATQPVDQTIASNASTTLSVVFNSASTATVRWYRGALGDKTNQIGTGSSVSTGALTSTTTFWAGITNACGETSTRLVTITVSACTQPAIATQSTPQTVLKGKTVTLNVNATGTAPLTYQWYEGGAGVTTKPVGTNSSTFTSAPLTSSTSFWVKVTNACGEANGTTIVVTVESGRRRAVRS